MLITADRQDYPADHAFENLHGIGCYTLELTYSGTMLRRSGHMASFHTQPNQTLLLTPPHTPYGLRGRARGEEIWLIFECPAGLQDCLQWPRGGFGIPELPLPRTPLGRQIVRAMEETCDYQSSRLPRRQQLAENALERLLLLASSLSTDSDGTDDARIRSALLMMEQRSHEAITVTGLARASGLSPSHFAHLFREQTGVTPIQYLETIRMEKAQMLLLRSDLRIQEVATRVGFDDPFYFSTRFRRRFGCSPRAWRTRPRPG